MAIYKDYLVGEEREAAIEEAAILKELDDAFDCFEMTNIKLNQMYRSAELKVFSESGTYDDLVYLMQEAEGEVTQQREGILDKIVAGIRSLINKIKSLFSNKSNGNPEDNVQIDEGYITTADKISAKWNEVKGSTAGKIGIGVAAIAAVVGGSVAVGKVVTKKRSEVESKQNVIKSVVDWLDNKINEVVNMFKGKGTNEQGAAQKELKPFNSLLSKLNSIMSGFNSALQGAKTAVADAVDKNITHKSEKEANAKAAKNIKEQNDGNKNGVLIKNINGEKYGIDRNNGTISKLVDGSWTSIDANEAPAKIQTIAKQQKGKTAAVKVNEVNAKAVENKKAVNSNYKPNKVVTNPDTKDVISINGKTGIISVKHSDGKVEKVDGIDNALNLLSGVKNRNLRKDLKTAYNNIQNGISDASKTQDAINATQESTIENNEELMNFLTESSLEYTIENDDLSIYVDNTMTESEIEEELNNDGYVVEFTEDNIIITEGEFVSLQESIFGTSLEKEFEESATEDAFDEEISDIANLFEEI